MAETSKPRKTIAILPLGLALSTFLAISYCLCIVGYLVLPAPPVKHEALSIFLPGFHLLTWRTFLIGFAESYAWGWYIAVLFTPLLQFIQHTSLRQR